MGKPHRDDVTGHDGDDRQIPDKARIDDADIDAIEHRAEQVPSVPEWIRRQRNDELTGDREQREIMREMVRDRDRNERQHERARQGGQTRAAGNPLYDADRGNVERRQTERARDQQSGCEQHVDWALCGFATAGRENRLDDRCPDRRFHNAVDGHAAEREQGEADHRSVQWRARVQSGREGPQRPVPDMIPPKVQRREPPEQFENDRKHVAAPEPHVAPERDASGEVQRKIDQHRDGDVARHVAAGGDQFEPHEEEEQGASRPCSEPRRVGPPQ